MRVSHKCFNLFAAKDWFSLVCLMLLLQNVWCKMFHSHSDTHCKLCPVLNETEQSKCENHAPRYIFNAELCVRHVLTFSSNFSCVWNQWIRIGCTLRDKRMMSYLQMISFFHLKQQRDSIKFTTHTTKFSKWVCVRQSCSSFIFKICFRASKRRTGWSCVAY